MSSESSSPKLEQRARSPSHFQESHHSHHSKKSCSSESEKQSHGSSGHHPPATHSHDSSRSWSRTPHAQHSFNPDAPSSFSSSSGSKGSHTTPHPHPHPHPHPDPALSHSRGRTPYRHSTLHSPSSSITSSSSSSTNPAMHNPFSIRDVENLDAVVNTHLDQLGLLLRDLDYHQDHLDRFEDEKKDVAWQLFLAQTGACTARCSGSGTAEFEASGGCQGQLMRSWEGAAKNERRAGRNVERLEGRLAEFVEILFRLVKEERRRGEKGKG
ncbi:hypothetical protein GE09DRAFT_1278448 [Coniochaeta sp. 2T2.1]|nr:hypothetical protein GE09DRAFT_1278448 [Coniochaeta sp. 2T2.1]